ncbi:hypothetical protein GALMADRAFT_247666 [Galerina marginata CBS 339.88]|uniref:SH3 domain-containing protein n=1 Tax=Galerina marginata (strain CBS 339.88) TaxID=685588 RepID=A0A067T1V1_GALM3|nr:hypothetical protein GALMADRAFT_247666 [Galerina marginata CBS 339.88]
MPSVQFLTRSEPSSDASSISNPVYIAGIIVAAVIISGVGIWMGLRFYRKRMAAKRESERGAAFLSVKGLVRDDAGNEKDTPIQSSMTQSKGFSRHMIDSSIVLPEKALALPPTSREAVIEFHRQSGSFPAPFAPKPFSFALSAASPRNSTLEPDSKSRNSFMSFTSSQNRFSVMSGTSSLDSGSATTRKVRQIFDPVLPDELLTRVGDQLTLVQSFDDGWCVVGREGSSLVHTAKSLFRPTPVPENNVELGVVPAWCFLKPVKGLRAERPVRSSSLGITINLDAPGCSSRNELLSWSNF